jgi:hypothetical protein
MKKKIIIILFGVFTGIALGIIYNEHRPSSKVNDNSSILIAEKKISKRKSSRSTEGLKFLSKVSELPIPSTSIEESFGVLTLQHLKTANLEKRIVLQTLMEQHLKQNPEHCCDTLLLNSNLVDQFFPIMCKLSASLAIREFEAAVCRHLDKMTIENKKHAVNATFFELKKLGFFRILQSDLCKMVSNDLLSEQLLIMSKQEPESLDKLQLIIPKIYSIENLKEPILSVIVKNLTQHLTQTQLLNLCPNGSLNTSLYIKVFPVNAFDSLCVEDYTLDEMQVKELVANLKDIKIHIPHLQNIKDPLTRVRMCVEVASKMQGINPQEWSSLLKIVENEKIDHLRTFSKMCSNRTLGDEHVKQFLPTYKSWTKEYQIIFERKVTAANGKFLSILKTLLK